MTITTQKWQAQKFVKNFGPSAGGRNEPVPQTRAGGLFPKMHIFGWQKIKGQFWFIFGLILFLFWL